MYILIGIFYRIQQHNHGGFNGCGDAGLHPCCIDVLFTACQNAGFHLRERQVERERKMEGSNIERIPLHKSWIHR